MPTYPSLLHTVLDTTEPRRLAEFYRELLGLHYRPGDEAPPNGEVDDADWLVLDRTWIHPVVLRTFFPGMVDPDPPEKRALEAALARTFNRVVHTWRGMELRGRGEAAGAAACGP